MNERNINNPSSRGAILTTLCADMQISHEVSEEFTLPDYVPEVRRVLNTRAKALPEGKFMSESGANTSLELDGTVTYSIIYTDDEGKLCSISLSSSYNTSAILSCTPQKTLIDTSIDNVSCRVNAPRKLTVKTRLKSRILAFSDDTIDENISPRSTADEIYIERRTKNVNTVSLKSISMQNIKMSDRFDMNNNSELTPIMCDAGIVINDCKAQSGSVSVRGEATVKCICSDGERCITLTKVLPVYEELEADGAEPSDMARCNARCISLAISNEQNSDTSQLFFDLNCEIEGEFYRNIESTLTEDCYSTKYETDASYRNIDTYSLLSAKNNSFSINDKFKRKDGNIEDIVDVICDAVAESAETANGKLIFKGRINALVIGRSKMGDDGAYEYLSESYEIPFGFDVLCDAESVVSRATYDVKVTSARYDNDKFAIGCDIYSSYVILKKGSDRILDSAIIKKDKEYKGNAACVRVFFPKDGDILWEVAKKYHTTER